MNHNIIEFHKELIWLKVCPWCQGVVLVTSEHMHCSCGAGLEFKIPCLIGDRHPKACILVKVWEPEMDYQFT